jgi:predicted TIM-barrel fold metal-dependent hydrolase
MEKIKIMDCHFHIIDSKFPLVPNEGYLPPPFTAEDFIVFSQSLPYEFVGGAIVSGSFQLYDQTYLAHALDKLRSDYVGVAQLESNVSDEEIIRLHSIGVRAVRFNLKRGVSQNLLEIRSLMNRVYELVGWHSEFYLDSSMLKDPHLFSLLSEGPKIVIDHLGMNHEYLGLLLQLLQVGQDITIKATGFGRINFNRSQIISALQKITCIRPTALVFGTDMPGTRARVPFHCDDVDLIIEALGEELAKQVLCENGRRLYGLVPMAL